MAFAVLAVAARKSEAQADPGQIILQRACTVCHGIGEITKFLADEFGKRFKLTCFLVRNLACALVISEHVFVKGFAGGFPFAGRGIEATGWVLLAINGDFGVAFLEAFGEIGRLAGGSLRFRFHARIFPLLSR